MATFWNRVGTALRLVEASTPDSPVENAEAPKKVSVHYDETGSSGTTNYAGYYSEEYLHNLRGRPAADVWDKMRRSDARIKMVLAAVKNPIKAAHWSVQLGQVDGGVPNGEKHAQLVEQILFRDLELSWTQQLSEILTLVDFGFSAFEVINKVVKNDPMFGTYNSVAKLAFRSQRTIERWNLDPKTGQLVSISQYAYGDLQRLVDIPGEFLLVFSNEKEGDNYEGVSALRPCYGAWTRKNTYLKLMAIGIQKFAVPTPYMEVPEGKEGSQEYANAKKILEKFVSHEKQYIMYPKGWTVGFASPSNFDASKIRDAIDKENSEIAQAFLQNFLELGSSGGSGSYALGTDLSDFFLVGIEHIANGICEVFNKNLIPNLVKMNFGPQRAYPKLVCSGVTDKPGRELSEVISNLLNSKAITPDEDLEDDLREKYGLPNKQRDGVLPLPQPAPAVAPPAAPAPIPAPEPAAAKMSSLGMLACQAVDISKKHAISMEDAKRIAAEIGASTDRAIESEEIYRFEQQDPGLFEEGTLRTFKPMEGVTVYMGNLKVMEG